MRKYRIMFDGICRKIAMLFNVVVSVSIGLCCISVVCYVLQYGLQVFGTKFLIKNNQNHKKHWKILMLTMFHIRSKSIKWQDSLDWLIHSLSLTTKQVTNNCNCNLLQRNSNPATVSIQFVAFQLKSCSICERVVVLPVTIWHIDWLHSELEYGLGFWLKFEQSWPFLFIRWEIKAETIRYLGTCQFFGNFIEKNNKMTLILALFIDLVICKWKIAPLLID